MKYIIQIAVVVMAMCGSGYSQSQDSLLSKAYETKSNVLLDKFFENWRMEKTPITDEEYAKLKDAEKDVYDIFYEFYTPKDLSKLNLYSFEYEYYKNIKYFVIGSKMEYGILRTDNYDSLFKINANIFYKDSSFQFKLFEGKNDIRQKHLQDILFTQYSQRYSIKNFVPRIKVEDIEVLYSNEVYDSAIIRFIRNDFEMTENKESTFIDSLEQKKFQFINPYIKVIKGQLGSLIVETCPLVFRFDFTKDRNIALLHYSFINHSGYSVYNKINGIWTFIKDNWNIDY